VAQFLVLQNLAAAATHLFFYVREVDPSHKAINEADRRFAQSLLRPDNRTRLRNSWRPHNKSGATVENPLNFFAARNSKLVHL